MDPESLQSFSICDEGCAHKVLMAGVSWGLHGRRHSVGSAMVVILKLHADRHSVNIE